LVEEVLARINVDLLSDVRRWLERDMFAFHLKQYSQGGRKAPIYWPISTSSGRYTLWLYYPSLTDQSLFTAVNEFIDPKLKQVGQDLAALRTKGSDRSRDDEQSFEVTICSSLRQPISPTTMMACRSAPRHCGH
jgi:hypothetical protein